MIRYAGRVVIIGKTDFLTNLNLSVLTVLPAFFLLYLPLKQV